MKFYTTLIGTVFMTASAVIAQDCSTDKAHQFDFWIGEWNVTAGGQQAGTSLIEPILDGCVIQENWVGASGAAGSSLNFYNPRIEKWEQMWVWRNGTTILTSGEFSDGKMVLEGESTRSDGTTVLNRITWSANDDGSVRQFWQTSLDEGETWTDSFDGHYQRKE